MGREEWGAHDRILGRLHIGYDLVRYGSMDPEKKKIADAILKEWADRGTVIEGGWQAFLYLGKLEDASEVQKGEMRRAFYIGAQHLFASLLGIIDPGLEPTEADLKKVDLIAAELERFRKEELGSK